MLSHLENYNHPEPLRVWPEDQYGRGDLLVNFATTKTTDWTLLYLFANSVQPFIFIENCL